MSSLNVSLPLSDRLTEAQLDEVGDYIGGLLKPAYDSGKQNAICKWLFDNGSLEFIEGYSVYLAKHSKDIMDSELLLAWFRRNSVFCDVMYRAVSKFGDLDVNLVNEYMKKDLPGMYEYVFEDLSVIGLWIVLHGGTSDAIRRMINSTTEKYIGKIEKRVGLRGMMTMLWRASYWYSMLAKKLYNPRLKELQKSRIRAERKKERELNEYSEDSFNSMASAFTKMRKR